MKRPARDLIKCLETHGYEHVRTNSKQFLIYARGDVEITVNPNVGEGPAREAIRKIDRADGTAPDPHKRNAQAIKERQGKQRQALRDQITKDDAERARLQAEHDRQLNGHAATLRTTEILAIQRRIEQRKAELRQLEALMAVPPLDNRVRHRS